MIESLKDLERLLKLCRKQGVTEIKLRGCEFKLGDLPQAIHTEAVEEQKTFEDFPDRVLTPEELMFYSAGGNPNDEGAPQ